MATKRTSTATKHPPQEDVEDDLSIEYPSSDGEPMAESEFQYIPLTDTVAALRHWFIHRDRRVHRRRYASITTSDSKRGA